MVGVRNSGYCRGRNDYQYHGAIFLIELQYQMPQTFRFHTLLQYQIPQMDLKRALPQIDLERMLVILTRPVCFINRKPTLHQPQRPFKGTLVSVIISTSTVGFPAPSVTEVGCYQPGAEAGAFGMPPSKSPNLMALKAYV